MEREMETEMGIKAGKRIRELRTQKGLTQEALALELGISRQAVAKWEAGQTAPSTANLVALSRLLNVPLEKLTEGKPQAGGDIPEAENCPESPGEPKVVPETRGEVAADPSQGKGFLPAWAWKGAVAAGALAVAAAVCLMAGEKAALSLMGTVIGGADGPTQIFITGHSLGSRLLLWLGLLFLGAGGLLAWRRRAGGKK
jgi:LPXTG-motif cell wall-anchored protein